MEMQRGNAAAALFFFLLWLPGVCASLYCPSDICPCHGPYPIVYTCAGRALLAASGISWASLIICDRLGNTLAVSCRPQAALFRSIFSCSSGCDRSAPQPFSRCGWHSSCSAVFAPCPRRTQSRQRERFCCTPGKCSNQFLSVCLPAGARLLGSQGIGRYPRAW